MKIIHDFFHKHYHTRYHGVYKHAKQLFVFDMGLLILAIGIFVAGLYFAFWKPKTPDYLQISLSLAGLSTVSGEQNVLLVDYTNKSKEVLRNPTIALVLPRGFVINRSLTPTSTLSENNVATILDLPPGASGQVSVHGYLYGEPGASGRFLALATFRAESATAKEQSSTSLTYSVAKSTIAVSILAPTSSYPGTTVPIKATITNDGPLTANLVILETVPPELLSSKDTQPFTLEPGAHKDFAGELPVPKSGRSFSVALRPAILINGVPITQAKTEKTIAIFNPHLDTSITINNNTAYAEPGQTIPVTVNWKNAGNSTVADFKIRLTFTEGVVDLLFTARLNRATIDGESLLLTKQSHTVLANGKPGASGSIVVPVVLRPTFLLGEVENARLAINPVAEGSVAAVGNQTFNLPGIGVQLPLATELTWSSQTRYYTDDGDQLGRGPLPPRVGQTTKYWVWFDIHNTTNEINNSSFVAKLAPGVTFTDNQSVTLGQKLIYDTDKHEVRWNYGQIPANSQTGLYFEVAVTPAASQVGQNINLIESARFYAKDDVVGKEFDLSRGAMNNQLLPTDKGSKSGSVVK